MKHAAIESKAAVAGLDHLLEQRDDGARGDGLAGERRPEPLRRALQPPGARLREEFAVYILRSGRLCVAGLNSGNVEATAIAMAAVMAG